MEYTFKVNDRLKSHHNQLDKKAGIIAKGKQNGAIAPDKFIRKKAHGIIEKLETVHAISNGNLVTGSQIPYLGKEHKAEFLFHPQLRDVQLNYINSKFRILINLPIELRTSIQFAINEFYRNQAIEKITPRVKKWSALTGLKYSMLKFQRLEKSWGSCTVSNNIIINIEAIKLPLSLIDYLIVHLLCHIKVKSHSNEFWLEVSKHIPNWKELDANMLGMKM